jgi:hypothetical protein
MHRGDRQEPIFKDDADRRRFLDTLGEACAQTGWRVQAWCRMDNHFHLLVETPKANLVEYGEEAWKSDVEQAESVVKEGLKRLGWSEEDLMHRRKGDRKKVKLALRLRQETTMTLKWIAHRLKMGAAGSLANKLRMFRTNEG